ncbi:MAG: CoB--CoM heterodisulfide reductase iron-sulfur subunit A family protein [Proteobacteria bacterium]|nr:CoB--CoM heterodisulfide reductase iron-sulfur subunit A family protein [Pseudomonadota bacterium]MBU1740468.1 CoB--CoM heterodisulfide reductase iron-sulfur subunit A family protein [Pseudomonadota bacterium]
MADDQAKSILVVGGGMSGLTAAVEAAEVGRNVVLVEKNPYLGGRVAQLHQYFPKLCPPACGLEINFRRVRESDRIGVYTLTEVESISGSEGDFEVTLKVNPRYVNDNCTACGKCAEAVETTIPNPFNFGMDQIKAAYLPYTMAYPLRYVIDPSIAGTDEGKKAAEACAYGAVDLDQRPETVTLNVGSIVWAAGWDPYDAAQLDNYGFGAYPNVITNVMMERLAAADGPTGGQIVRPGDGAVPGSVAFVQCAGSRDENHLAYCSGICCLASMKQATYVREQLPDTQAFIFFIDIRAQDRLEEFYETAKLDAKLKFVKSKIALITEDPATGGLILEGEDTQSGQQIRQTVDLVVLATGMVPTTSRARVPADLSYDDYGFISVDSGVAGIVGAGCVKRPNDVSSSVQDATAAAMKALVSAGR